MTDVSRNGNSQRFLLGEVPRYQSNPKRTNQTQDKNSEASVVKKDTVIPHSVLTPDGTSTLSFRRE